MKISVIIPVYKVEKYLDKCVESIVNQTYKNLEIILVDDGSPDNCPAMCDEWAEKDERIRVIHKENGGVSSARNAALEVATGDYIGFVDSDDWIELDMYEYLVSLILDNDAQIAIIYDMLRRNYSKVGIYKYDAFNVENSLSGGSISFALTLLNSRDNGFILNVIHNRAGCHVYLKEIKEAVCEQVLAEEEKISLDMALKYDEKKETDK